jgi:hypothetical protein
VYDEYFQLHLLHDKRIPYEYLSRGANGWVGLETFQYERLTLVAQCVRYGRVGLEHAQFENDWLGSSAQLNHACSCTQAARANICVTSTNGGLAVAISIMQHPNDQISAGAP